MVFVRGYVPYASEYIKEQRSHELCTVILYILSAENKQTLSNPLKRFPFENPKL